MADDATSVTQDWVARCDHWAVRLLDERGRRRHEAALLIPARDLQRQIRQSTSLADLAARLGVPELLVEARLDSLDEDETWELAGHLITARAPLPVS